MTLATEVKKLTESKPSFAVAGAGDYAVEKLRELPEQLQKLRSRRTEIAEDARGYAGKAEVAAREFPGKAREYADKADQIAREFPERAREAAEQIAQKATEVYEEFATRGRQVITKTLEEAKPEPTETVEVTVVKPSRKPRASTTRTGTTQSSTTRTGTTQ